MHVKSRPLSHQRLALLLSSLLTAFLVDGQCFTEEPPSILYVVSGDNATFNWKYFVADRKATFDIFSPKWSFYDENGIENVIGNDFKLNDSWNWKTDLKNCPQRLLKPTRRVFREENATLIITKVTTADIGMYGCTLVLKSPPPVKSKIVRLIVTVAPQINLTGETEVIENGNLTLNCSAVGPPTPNVTWINSADVVLEQGIQSATLIINNITREKAGIYKCKATNNPNEDPVQEKITVTVKYSPEINEKLSSSTVQTCPGDPVVLVCAAKGIPLPTHYWYNPSNKTVGEIKTGRDSEISVTNPVNGNWTCYIANGVGPGIYLKVQMEVRPKNHNVCKPFT